MKNGEHLDFLLKQQRKGKHIEVLDKMPVVFEDLEEVWKAFQVLNNARTCGMQANPIPVSEMEAWFRLTNAPAERISEYVYLIQALDKEVLNANTKSRN